MRNPVIEIKMAEQWISAPQALELVGSNLALCGRMKSGLIASRARLLLIDDEAHGDATIPTKFWWAEGFDALDQDWIAGDFAAWIDHSQHWQAYGVVFALSGVLQMLPSERRGIVSRTLSVVGSDLWVSASAARQFAYSRAEVNPMKSAGAVLDLARLGFITGRAVRAEGVSASEWTLAEREWDIPPWFWERLVSAGGTQDWDRGKFGAGFKGRDGERHYTLDGVHFLRESLDALLPAPNQTMMAPAPASESRIKGGRPPAAFADNLMCAIWGLIYQGDLNPKTQAEVERAILDWASLNNHEIGVTAARGKARKIFTTLLGEVENPTQ